MEKHGVIYIQSTPDYSVYVIKEDYVDENLLFVGTEKSVYFSNDRGTAWEKLGSNLPTVAIHDLVIHPEMEI